MKNVLNEKLEKYVYYVDDGILILNGDVNEVLSVFPEETIDLIVTSPPYNVGIDYLDWNDSLPIEEYFEFVKKFLRNFKKVLKEDGRFVINVPYDVVMNRLRNPTRVSLLCEYYNLLKEVGLNYQSIIDLKEKAPHRIKKTAWGSYLSASAPYQYCPKEALLIGYKKQWKKKNKGVSTIDKKLFIECASGMWEYRAETRGLTKANFSTDIPYKAIQSLSYKNDIILDPFMGSGTTGISCIDTDRKFIGIEISKEYCKIAKDRLLEHAKRRKK